MTEQDPLIGIQTDSEDGRRLDILELIGEGGMSTVYKAVDLDPPEAYVQEHPNTPRIVAVKYLDRKLVESDHCNIALARFNLEALTANTIKHPNIMEVLNMGMDQEGRPYLVMEYFEGACTLSGLIAEAQVDGSRKDPVSGKINGSLIPPAQLFPILLQVGSALGELHRHKIIHRDVKPENILIKQTESGPHALLIDLGILKRLEDEPEKHAPKLTQEGESIGTPYYMPPEQFASKLHPDTQEPWGLGPWSDVWALGITLYEMATGKLPFFHDQIGYVIAFVADDTYPPHPIDDEVVNLDPALRRLIELCMVKPPWARPQNMEVVRQLVLAAQASVFDSEGLVRQGAPGKPAPARTQPAGRTRGLVGAVMATFLLLGVVGTIIFHFAVNKPSASVAEEQSVVAPSVPIPTQAPLASPVAAAVSPGVTADGSTHRTKRKPDPGPQPGDPLLAKYTLGMKQYRDGNCYMAERLLNPVVGKHFKFPPPLKALAVCELKAGRIDDARKHAQQYDTFEVAEPLGPDLQALLPPSP